MADPRLTELNAKLAAIGDKPLAVESSIVTPEGLLITCTDGVEARRARDMICLFLPKEAHYLITVNDRRVLCKWAPGTAPLTV